MARAVLHDHHDFDNGGPIRNIPVHDHTTIILGGELPPPPVVLPPETTCCPPEPPFVQGSCGDPTAFLQGVGGAISGSIGGSTPTSSTYTSPPTTGNLLMAILWKPVSGVEVVTSSWDAAWTVTEYLTVTDRSMYVAIGLKIAEAGEASLVEVDAFSDTGGGPNHSAATLMLTEYENFGGLPTLSPLVVDGVNNPSTTASLPTISPVDDTMVVALYGVQSAGYTLTGTTGTYIEELAGSNTSGTGWNLYLADQYVATGGGSYTGTLTRTGLSSLNAQMIHLGMVRSCILPIPKPGQRIYPEQVTFTGLEDSIQTNYDYRAGGLHFFLSGVRVILTETDPTTGLATLPAGIGFPEAGEIGVWDYDTEFGMATGANNPSAVPSEFVLRPATAVIDETTFGLTAAVGDNITSWARADHSHGTPTDPTSSAPASFDRLLTVYNGTNWLPLVDGDGNALYTYV